MFLHNRAMRSAYYEGVIDSTEYDYPDPGRYGDLGGNQRRYAELGQARRQGFHDGKAGQVLRPHAFSVDKVLRRAEIQEVA